MRLKDKIAIVVGAGQAPGTSSAIGNGRATCVTFAREGAKVVCADRRLDSAEETAAMIRRSGGEAIAVETDVVKEDSLKAMVKACMDKWGRVDILHNNVGISVEGGDAEITKIEADAFDRIMTVNLRGMILACKHVIPIMRQQRDGVILNISSMASLENYPWVSYKTSKAGINAMTQQIAIQNAEYGIRCNAILPGLMDTPMAVDRRAEAWGKSRAEVEAERNAKVPLRNKMGTAWDVANAALFLASEEAQFITGIILPVDGGRSVKVG